MEQGRVRFWQGFSLALALALAAAIGGSAFNDVGDEAGGLKIRGGLRSVSRN
jgi:hypothetical protein